MRSIAWLQPRDMIWFQSEAHVTYAFDGGDEEYYLVEAHGYDLVPERGSRDQRICVLLPS